VPSSRWSPSHYCIARALRCSRAAFVALPSSSTTTARSSSIYVTSASSVSAPRTVCIVARALRCSGGVDPTSPCMCSARPRVRHHGPWVAVRLGIGSSSSGGGGGSGGDGWSRARAAAVPAPGAVETQPLRHRLATASRVPGHAGRLPQCLGDMRGGRDARSRYTGGQRRAMPSHTIHRAL
jgi:hypothetical protein